MNDGNVMIHVRFSADGTVTEIGERPTKVAAQQWFNHLSQNEGTSFMSLSGGRGIFRLPRDRVNALKTTAPMVQ